jgi:hypothetical protein
MLKINSEQRIYFLNDVAIRKYKEENRRNPRGNKDDYMALIK